ncbi:uncharacterized protein [Euwallacea similis]|uniref:uncharacterized protein n=1 Tax=Euwallacea similis TaxID=1736056 RepID=UPI00344C5062
MFLSRLFQLSSLKLGSPVIQRWLTTQPQQISKIQLAPLLNHWIYPQNYQIQSPVPINSLIDLPGSLLRVPPHIEPIKIKNEIIAPSTENSETPKLAIRMIVIRRKKMKKHKLKKLRKKMKFEWAKRRQRREMKKEKAFQAILINQCKEAESFSAEDYVNQKLGKLNEVIIPKYWKGKKLFREKIELPPK